MMSPTKKRLTDTLNLTLIYTLILVATFSSTKAQAYMPVAESNELLPSDSLKLGLIPQFSSGLNAIFHLDTSLNESSSLRFVAGGGDVDFITGAAYKWVPIPDYGDQQPALGLRTGVYFARKGTENSTVVKFDPMISKKKTIEGYNLVPYATIPLAWANYKARTEFQVQVVVGSEYLHPDYPDWTFGAELGLNGTKSYSFVALYASVLIDQFKGIRVK